MDFSDCIAFAKRSPVCHVATVDHGRPRVRAFLLWFADFTGFYFHTIEHKDIVMQLIRDPAIEVCFTLPPCPPEPVQMMRISGEAEFMHDPALRTRLIDERPFITRMGIATPEDMRLTIFRIPHGEARIWKMENFLLEKEMDTITF